jgi:GTP-binding protein EngB required for normal cell division
VRTEQPLFIEDRVKNAIESVASIAELHGEHTAVERLHALKERLERKSFNVAILGEFKRGKSTLVNALLGGPVLPTGVLPLTSIPTRVSWGAQPAATIALEAGPPRTVPIDALAGYVTEAGNPRNRLGVISAQVVVPSPLLRSGVVIVDTPGVGSTLEHNTDMTLATLPEVDAAIFLTAANPPISENERRFLRAVRAHAPKIFFVVNKMDMLEAGERDEVLTFTRDVIADAVGMTVDVFGVSALDSLTKGDAGMQAFTDAFTGFLDVGLVRTGMASVSLKATEVLAQLRAGVSVELEALRLTEQEIIHRRDAVADVAVRTDEVRRDLGFLVHHEVARTVEVIEAALARWKTSAAQELVDVAERAVAQADVAPGELDEIVEAALRSHLEAERPRMEGLVAETFSAATERFIAQAHDQAERARQACSQILDLPLPPVPSVDGLQGRSRFTFSFFRPPTLVESLLPDLPSVLPKRRGQRLALARVRDKIPQLVDKHAGRLRYDLVQRLQDTARSLTRALDANLRGTLESLELALKRALVHVTQQLPERAAETDRLIVLEQELFGISDALWDAVRDLQGEATSA